MSAGSTDAALPIVAKPDDAPPIRDPLFDCIAFLARRFGLSANRDKICAGLPLEDDKLTVGLLPRAVERAGMRGKLSRLPADRLSAFDLPVIAMTRAGTPVVVVERNGRSLSAFDPAAGQTRTLDGRKDLARRQAVLIVKPASHAEEETDARLSRHWLRAALVGHWRSLFFVLLAAVLINLFAVAMPIFTMNVYDRVLPNKAISTLWVLAIGLFVVFGFDLLLKITRSAIIDFAGRQIDHLLASALFERIANAAIASHPASTGGLVNRVAQYEVLRDFLTAHTLVMFIDVLFMGIFIYVMSTLVGWVVIFPVIGAAVSLVATLIIGRLARAPVSATVRESSNRNALLVESLSAMQTVKLSRAEGQFQRRWEATILQSSETQARIKMLQSLASLLTATIGQVSSVAIIVAATYLFSEGHTTTGAIIAAMMLSSRVIAPVAMISAAILRTRSAIEAHRTLTQIMTLPDERRRSHGFVSRHISEGSLEFRQVRFAYPNSGTFVLDQVSFRVSPGEKVGIIGRVGSGKTTLGRLMVNFYPPSEGEILIDGVSIQQYHPAELRRQVGLVLQDPELFSGTVRENILLSDPLADEARLLDVARCAGVEAFVSLHPSGFDMQVGERGVMLSGGQRQAVALARTLLAEPKILFLDEPSSSMDLATERQLIAHLEESLKPEHTALIATHRFSLLKLVDRIMVVDQGKIVADGPRDAVLQQLRSQTGVEA